MSLLRIVIGIAAACTLTVLQVAAQPDRPKDDHVRTFDLIVRSEVTTDRPVKEVWPYFLDMGAWMTDSRFRTVEGRRGEEGEVQVFIKEKDKSYLITALRVTPLERYVLKVVPEHGDGLAFAVFSFSEAGGKTHMIYDLYYSGSTVFSGSEDEFRAFCERQQETARRDIARNNQNLKTLVEAKQ